MKFSIHLTTAILIVLFLSVSCGDDEVTSPDESGDDLIINIASPSDGQYFSLGDTIHFSGNGKDHKGEDMPDSVLVWTLDHGPIIGIGSSCESCAIPVGTHAITLTGIDTEWGTGSASITIYVTPVTPDFVLIPPDTFTMGSPSAEFGRQDDEALHLVTLTRAFRMSSTEVTNQQYANMAQWAYDNGYCAATSSSLRDSLDGSTEKLLDLDADCCEISFSEGIFKVDSDKADHPVQEVSWYGAAAYCDWLSLASGLNRAYDHSTWKCNGHDPYSAGGYRLPTEAEWEYACRAGTGAPFYTGDCLDAGTEANYDGTHPYFSCPKGTYESQTMPAGSYPPNAFGLYEMHGNINEWCNDWYGSYSGDETDPTGPVSGSYPVFRGGCALAYGESCRSADRTYGVPYSTGLIGIRLVRTAD